jgi:uncharacterized protein
MLCDLEKADSFAYLGGMDRDMILATLRTHEQALRHRGVMHAALFGSVARNEGTADSDIDILIEVAPEAAVGVFEYVGITQYLADLFPQRVDVASRTSLKALVKPNAERDAIFAF